MGRPPCCDENGLKKGPWTPEEDEKLTSYIQKHGHGSWKALPELAGLNRCGKSCRLRWANYLRPDIKRGKFSQEEEQTILQLHSILGNKWSAIAKHLPGRTDNETEAVQAAKLQYMQSLLQSAASIATSPTTINSLNTLTTDLEQIGLLSPLQMPSPSVLEGIGGIDLAGQVLHNQMPRTFFDHPIGNNNLSADNNVKSSEQCRGEGENSSQKSLLLSENSLPPLIDMSTSNLCNTISTSNCDGSSSLLPSWSEILLDEELMSEFA